MSQNPSTSHVSLESQSEYAHRKARESSGHSLKFAMRLSIVMTELQHLQVQFRLIAALLAGALIFDLLDPAMLLLAGSRSLIWQAANSTSLGTFGYGLMFLLLAALVVPFLAMQCGCWKDQRRTVTKLTVCVLCLASFVWFFLAWRAVHLDIGHAAPILFARNGAGSFLFALALAMSLNAEQLRTLLEQPA